MIKCLSSNVLPSPRLRGEGPRVRGFRIVSKKLLAAIGLMLLPGGCGSEAPMPVSPTEKEAPQRDEPAYGFPLEITVEGIPEVPKEIMGPSAPIEEEEE